MTTAEQRAAFEAALDEKPDWWAMRLTYADWLEEHGEHELAAAQRWMGENEKRPVHWSGMKRKEIWCWTRRTNPSKHPSWKPCTLPRELFELLPNDGTFCDVVGTRIAAEAALAGALARLAKGAAA